MKPYISFVIPARNEEESLAILHQEIVEVMKKINESYELIFIDDGSTDNTFQNLKKLQTKDKRVRAIKLRGNFGKSVALQLGFDFAQGELIFTFDADLQDNPVEIPSLLKELDKGYDMISGWKKKRHDPWTKVLSSRIINFLTRTLTGIDIHDTNCGLKLYRREVTESLNLYGELYRFIPVFAAKQNFKIGEIAIEHRARRFGKSNFGWGRGIKGVLDLITVVFLTGYIKRPGHFFGTLGLLSFTGGFIIGLYITYLRITTGSIQYHQPLLIFGMLLMIIGIQLISTGLLAEMIVFPSQKVDYKSYAREII